MRTRISITLGEADRRRLDVLVADRNTAEKHVRRARVGLLSADGVGPSEIMAVAGPSKTTVRRWQGCFMGEGVRDPAPSIDPIASNEINDLEHRSA